MCAAGVGDRVSGAGYVAANSALDYGRLWLLRLGHARLTMVGQVRRLGVADRSLGADWPREVPGDFGNGLRDLPERGECLQHTDLHLVALLPRNSWTKQEVNEAVKRQANALAFCA